MTDKATPLHGLNRYLWPSYQITGPVHYAIDELDGDNHHRIVRTVDAADYSVFTASSFHPVDSHEFGMSVSVNPAVVSLGEFQRETMLRSLKEYMVKHPDGEDKE